VSVLPRLRRFLHRATLPPTVAAHHPLPTVVDLGPAPRHTHRDPTIGRYTRKEQ